MYVNSVECEQQISLKTNANTHKQWQVSVVCIRNDPSSNNIVKLKIEFYELKWCKCARVRPVRPNFAKQNFKFVYRTFTGVVIAIQVKTILFETIFRVQRCLSCDTSKLLPLWLPLTDHISSTFLLIWYSSRDVGFFTVSTYLTCARISMKCLLISVHINVRLVFPGSNQFSSFNSAPRFCIFLYSLCLFAALTL